MFSPFPGEVKPKLDIAKECILGILKRLSPSKIRLKSRWALELTYYIDDYVGLVVFNDHAQVVFPLEQVAQLSMEKIKYELDILSAKGATNMVK